LSNPVNPNDSLGQNAFLQLMMTQMQNQDPLSPQDNSQFLSQLAQFTSLEQMTNVDTQEQQVAQTLSVLEAHQLLGSNVTVQNADGSTASGTVSSIKFSNGAPQLVVNGTAYGLDTLQQMEG
jgi:flagellar basal-body rod modification protein FlgD